LHQYRRKWECIDPRITACPTEEPGVSLGVFQNADPLCRDSTCPEDYVLKNPYGNGLQGPYYECQKKSRNLCPGDGVWKKEMDVYRCVAPRCNLIQTGPRFYCPADPNTCQDAELTPTEWPVNAAGHLDWYCANKVESSEALPIIIVLFCCVLFAIIIFWYMKKSKAEKVKLALMTGGHGSFIQNA